MFTRKPAAQPVATVAPVVDADPEPRKLDAHGYITPEWTRWEWRDAERRVRANRQPTQYERLLARHGAVEQGGEVQIAINEHKILDGRQTR